MPCPTMFPDNIEYAPGLWGFRPAVNTLDCARQNFLDAVKFFLNPVGHCGAHGRPTNGRCDVRSAGVADWITARGGIRSVRSPLRRPPLLATPIAKPLQCGRP